jgi:hypothetical protein
MKVQQQLLTMPELSWHEVSNQLHDATKKKKPEA